MVYWKIPSFGLFQRMLTFWWISSYCGLTPPSNSPFSPHSSEFFEFHVDLT